MLRGTEGSSELQIMAIFKKRMNLWHFIERELEREEKKLELEIKKAAKMGNKQVLTNIRETMYITYIPFLYILPSTKHRCSFALRCWHASDIAHSLTQSLTSKWRYLFLYRRHNISLFEKKQAFFWCAHKIFSCLWKECMVFFATWKKKYVLYLKKTHIIVPFARRWTSWPSN